MATTVGTSPPPTPTPATRTASASWPAPARPTTPRSRSCGTSLRTNAVFDFEAKSSYSIRVRATDTGALTFEEVFTITVTNVNEAPTDIALTSSHRGREPGRGHDGRHASTTDPDAGDTFTYSLVAGTGSPTTARSRSSAPAEDHRRLRLRDEVELLDPRPHHRRAAGCSVEKEFTIRSPTSTRRR